MRAQPPPYPNSRARTEPTREYRVVLWEQPEMDGVDPEMIGWGETFDLIEVEDVHEAIEWAEKQLAENAGPYHGVSVRDREYVIYAKVPGEDRFLQVAGWDPFRAPAGDNLRRHRSD